MCLDGCRAIYAAGELRPIGSCGEECLLSCLDPGQEDVGQGAGSRAESSERLVLLNEHSK